MSTAIDEIVELLGTMPDDEVRWVLDDAKRRARRYEEPVKLPSFVGMFSSGTTDGSTPEAIDAVLAKGFGRD